MTTEQLLAGYRTGFADYKNALRRQHKDLVEILRSSGFSIRAALRPLATALSMHWRTLRPVRLAMMCEVAPEF
jgi:hypothetical protein